MKTVDKFNKSEVISSCVAEKIAKIVPWAKEFSLELTNIAIEDLHHYVVRGFKGNMLIDVRLEIICEPVVLEQDGVSYAA